MWVVMGLVVGWFRGSTWRPGMERVLGLGSIDGLWLCYEDKAEYWLLTAD